MDRPANRNATRIISRWILDIKYPKGIYRVVPFTAKKREEYLALICAIRALKELEQRDTGCAYCVNHRIDTVRMELVHVGADKTADGINPVRTPAFCPICGRRLRDGENR